MKKLVCLLFVAVLLGIGACSGNAERGTAGLPKNHQQILDRLRAGSVGIFVRHAATNWNQNDIDRENLQNCDTQRNLSDTGRLQALTLGDAFARLKLPVGEVLSSPYCRCVDTAMLAFERSRHHPHLRALAKTKEDERQKRVKWLKDQFATTQAGRITVWVAHQYNLQAAAGWTVNEGETAVIEPQAGGGFKVLATLTPEQWQALAAMASE